MKASSDRKKEAKKAAGQISSANIQSAKILEEAGRKAEADILREQAKAVETVGLGAAEAESRISPFAGQEAFNMAREQILKGLPVSGPIIDSIRNASTQFVASRPEIFQLSAPVKSEVERQAGITASGELPAFRSALTTAGQQEIATAGDIAGIRQRGLESLGDIAAATGAQRASVLVGQTPQLATLSAGAQEARLLGDVAGQQADVQLAENLAGIAGRSF
jgi:hypothetical protein